MAGFFTFILIVQTLVAVALITLILMQRSEGGGLAGGGSPAGMMSARGASDFLTRGTAILATAFICLSILLAAMAAGQRSGSRIDPGLATPAPATPAAPGGAIPGLPKANPATPATAPAAAANQSGGAPLAQ
jgi:preprotein translocase subunit SecG